MKAKKKITHIIPYNVYGFKFIKLLEHREFRGEHHFIFYSFSGAPTFSVDDYPKSRHKISRMGKNLVVNWITILKVMISSKVVVQHGLFDPRHIISYNFVPFLRKKLYWYIWGADLYYGFDNYNGIAFRVLSLFRFRLLNILQNVISILESDLIFFSNKFNSNAKRFFLPYSYNLDFNRPLEEVSSKKIVRIMVGNNATEANHHYEVLQKVCDVVNDSNSNFKLLLPLSYGDVDYADSVSSYAIKLFGNKVEILRAFISNSEYNKILMTVDVAIFHHDMPEGMGVILQLLAYRKKVYIKSTNPLYDDFQSKRIKIYDSLSISEELFSLLAENYSESNYDLLNHYYSNNNVVNDWVVFLTQISLNMV